MTMATRVSSWLGEERRSPYWGSADVLCSVHVLGTRGGVWQHAGCLEVSVLAAYLAAAIHDYGHKNEWLREKTKHLLEGFL